MSCFARSDRIRDVQRQDEGKDVYIIVNAAQIDDGLVRLGHFQLAGLEMIVAVLIAYFELRRLLLAEFFLSGVEGGELLFAVRTFSVVAFVNSGFFAFFPGEERLEAIRTEISVQAAKTTLELKNVCADFAF